LGDFNKDQGPKKEGDISRHSKNKNVENRDRNFIDWVMEKRWDVLKNGGTGRENLRM